MNKIFIALLASVLCASANAALVQYAFSATIIESFINPSIDHPKELVVGEHVTGQFSYETVAEPSRFLSEACQDVILGSNPGECLTYDSSVDYQITIGANTLRPNDTKALGQLSIANYAESAPADKADRFTIGRSDIDTNSLTSFLGDGFIGYLYLQFSDIGKNIFDSTQIPQSIDLADFSNPSSYNGMTIILQKDLQLSFVNIEINSITPVPLPAASWLFGLATAGLIKLSSTRQT